MAILNSIVETKIAGPYKKPNRKKQVDSLANELPEYTNWDELMYDIYICQPIEEGLQNSREVDTTPYGEIKRNISLPSEGCFGKQKRSGNLIK